MGERGVAVDLSMLCRWVIKYAPELEKQFRRCQQPIGRSWQVDETYGYRWRMFSPRPQCGKIPPRSARPPFPKGAFGSPPLTKEGQGGFRQRYPISRHTDRDDGSTPVGRATPLRRGL